MALRAVASIAVVLIVAASAACDDCALAACDATQRAAWFPALDQGIAGISVCATDTCPMCSYCDGTMSVRLTSSDAAVPVAVHKSYVEHLAAGDYVGCNFTGKSDGIENFACAPFTVEPGKVTTVNVTFVGDGSGAVTVFNPDG